MFEDNFDNKTSENQLPPDSFNQTEAETAEASAKAETNGEKDCPKIDFSLPETQPIILKSALMGDEIAERDGVKKVSGLAGITFLAIVLLVTPINFIPYRLMSAIGFSDGFIKEFLNNPAILEVRQIFNSILLFVLPPVCVFKIGKCRISDAVLLNRPKKGSFWGLVGIGIGFCGLANVFLTILSTFFDYYGVSYSPPEYESADGIFGKILMLISIVIVPALVEEFACRGLAFGSMVKYGEGFAVVCSAALFGLMHCNFKQIPFAFFIGLVLGYITVKSGSILPAMTVHAFNNLISFILDAFLRENLNFTEILYTALLCTEMLVAVISIFMLARKGFDFELKKGNFKLSTAKKTGIFFKNPFVIGFAIICLYKSMQYFV